MYSFSQDLLGETARICSRVDTTSLRRVISSALEDAMACSVITMNGVKMHDRRPLCSPNVSQAIIGPKRDCKVKSNQPLYLSVSDESPPSSQALEQCR